MKYKQKLFSRVGLGTVAALVLVLGVAGVSFAKFGGAALMNGGNNIDLQKGLVGWWKLDGNQKDSSPAGRDGSPIFGITPTYVADREGVDPGAQSFNGTNEALTADSTNLFPNPDFTITTWAKNTDTTSLGLWGDPQLSFQTYSIGLGSSNAANGSPRLQLCDLSANCSYQWNLNNLFPSVGDWSMITLIKTGSTITVYRNGQLLQTLTGAPVGAINPGSNAFDLGYTGSYYEGALDDFRIYNRAISAAEVSALYDSEHSTKISNGEKGLVGWWPLDGNAVDNTVNGNNGVVSNATLTTDRKGKSNAAYAFNGTSSYIQVPYAAVTRPTSAITVSAWIKISDNASTVEQRIVSTTESSGYALFLTGSSGDQCIAQQICFMVNALNNYQKVQASKTLIPNDTWTHLAGSYDPGTGAFVLYLNGNVVGTNNVGLAAMTYSVNNPLCIGTEATASDCSGGLSFTGSIDDVRIYNRALSSTEMQNMYGEYDPQISLNTNTPSSGLGNIYKGLVGSWNFNGNAMDDTVYSDNATENGATLTTDRKGRANSAYSFDGTQHISIPDNSILDDTTGSWAVWMKISSAASGNSYALMTKASSSSSFNGISIALDPNGMKAGLQIKNASTTSECEASNELNDGKWHQLVGVFTGDTSAVLYVDGVSGCTFTPPAAWSFNASSSLLIGSSSDGWWQPFNGSLDNIRIYNRALSAAEVQTLYQQYQ